MDYEKAFAEALDGLRQRGSWAEGVEVQYPSLTYPSHTSIVTGVRPSRASPGGRSADAR